MNKNMNEYKNKNQYFVTAWMVVIGLVLLSAAWGYNAWKNSLENSAISAYEKKLASDINALIEDKRDASMAIALTLAENPRIKAALEKSASPDEFNFKKLSAQLKEHTHFNNVWLQLIDAQGVSLLRSWSPKRGDSLIGVRQDIRDILAEPKVARTLSVGKFSLSVKSAVPIFSEDNQLLGLVEVISQFGTLAKSLTQTQKVDSVIVVDKRFRGQLIHAKPTMFIGDYYVVNENATPTTRALLSELGEAGLKNFGDYQIHASTIVGRHDIYDNNGQTIAYWFTFSNKSQIDFSEVKRVLTGYIYGIVLFLLLLAVLFIVYSFKRQSDGRRTYYRQIIDSASDIILVANRTKVVDVNQHFFDFYSDFSTLDEFLEKYEGVCNTFVKEEGFLQETISGQYWLDYVLKNKDKVHKAKIIKEGKPYFFAVKVREMQGRYEPLFNVLLQDITEQELYKDQLEHLSQTDALTEVGNRLYFNRNLDKEIQRSHRYHSDLSLLMFDVDFFKKVNDNYGHDVGDKVLIELARRIKSLLRETDIFCRFGGEEFAIIMPETGGEEAQNTAERLRKVIEEVSQAEFPTRLTISFGVGQLTKWDSEKSLLKRVDDALYRAKELGRNRVVVAQDDVRKMA